MFIPNLFDVSGVATDPVISLIEVKNGWCFLNKKTKKKSRKYKSIDEAEKARNNGKIRWH